MIVTTFTCARCGETKTHTDDLTTGYGYLNDSSGDEIKVCFACCGDADRATMRERKPIVLYYDGSTVSNWPGTLSLTPMRVKRSRHNIGRTRVDVWFRCEGQDYRGVNIGDNQVLRCKAIKGIGR